jgi:hypothetical protein
VRYKLAFIVQTDHVTLKKQTDHVTLKKQTDHVTLKKQTDHVTLKKQTDAANSIALRGSNLLCIS